MARIRVRRLVMIVVAALAAGMSSATVASAEGEVSLTTLSVSSRSVAAPSQVQVGYSVESDTALDWVNVAYSSPSGKRVGGQASDAPPLTGSISVPFVDGIENGVYELAFVEMRTTSGVITNFARSDGPSGTGQHALDFSQYDVTVSGSVYDIDAPHVSAVRVSPAGLEPGAPIEMRWTATEAHTATELIFSFTNDTPGQPIGSESVAVRDPAALAAGQATTALRSTALNGSYTLTRIFASDSLGNRAAYLPDGRISPMGGNQQWGSHTLDMATVRFTVSGSTQDVSPPVLSSVRTGPARPLLGAPVTVDYATTDGGLSLSSLQFTYLSPDGNSVLLFWDGSASIAKSGQLTTEPWQMGDYTLQRVDLSDSAGNDVAYLPDGTTSSVSARTTGAHSINFAGLTLRVRPSAVELEARSRPQSAELRWTSPEQEVPSITGYRIAVSPGGKTLTVPASASGENTTIVTGLDNTVKYSFAVTPLSAGGAGPSRTVTATPMMSPGVWGAGDVNRDGRNDLFARLPDGLVRLYRGSGVARFGGGTGVVDLRGRAFPADRIDGHASFLSLFSESNLVAEHISRNGNPLGGTPVGRGWGMRFIDGHADFTSDGIADIVAVTPSGSAYLYRGYGSGRYSRGSQIAAGWTTMQTVFAASDVTGDRKADLLVLDAKGSLWIHPGNGAGKFHARRLVGTGWGGLGALFSARDVTGDGRVDLGAVTMDGTLRVYAGRGDGTFRAGTAVSDGWAPYL